MSLVYVFNEGLLASLLINNKELHLEQFFSLFNPERHISVGEKERGKREREQCTAVLLPEAGSAPRRAPQHSVLSQHSVLTMC